MRARRFAFAPTAVLSAALLLSTAQVAQAQTPTIRLGTPEPSVFEGDPSGPTVLLNYTVVLSAASSQTVTVLFSTFSLGQGNAFGGASCATANDPGGTDYISATDRLVSIPPNTTSIQVPVTICRDDQEEFHQNFGSQTREDIGVTLTSPTNAVCGTACNGFGHIFDDDGTPLATVNSVSTREPATGSKLATFTVGLSHPHPGFESRVGFATRNGTARALVGTCGTPGVDYLGRSGSLTFPAGVTSLTFTIPVCGDTATESTETYFVDLTGQLNAIGSISPGTGSILDSGFPSSLGTFALDPDNAEVQPDEWLPYHFTWTLSTGVWRNLHSMELRVRQRDTNSIALWIRWEESTNTFQLCDGPATEGAAPASSRCGTPVAAGTATVLTAPLGRLDMSGTKATGSGPTGPSVTLDLLVSFTSGAANRTYDVEVAAQGDNGLIDEFVPAGVLTVARAPRRD